MIDPGELLANLRDQSARNRVGLWLMPISQIGQEANNAARLGIDCEDLRQVLLDRLPENTRFTGLNGEKLISLLDIICEQIGSSDCVLVYNLDLLIAGLSYQSQQEIWRIMWQSFPHRRRGLLLVMPDGADHLLPKPSVLLTWRDRGRLAGDITIFSE